MNPTNIPRAQWSLAELTQALETGRGPSATKLEAARCLRVQAATIMRLESELDSAYVEIEQLHKGYRDASIAGTRSAVSCN